MKFYNAGENAICAEWGDRIDETINQQVQSAYQNILAHPFAGFVEAVPAFCTLTIYYDLTEIKKTAGELAAFEFVENLLTNQFQSSREIQKITSREMIVPVCYDAEFGQDLAEVASLLKMPAEEIIRLHSEKLYRVFMIGFLPGFPYLGTVDEKIYVPRKTTPRIRVEAGSVGIAGMQTGIYPFESPGGWQIIGRTPLNLFDIQKDPPSFLRAGDEVQFEKISRAQFDSLKKN